MRHSFQPRTSWFIAQPLFGLQCQYRTSRPPRVNRSHSTSRHSVSMSPRSRRAAAVSSLKYWRAHSRPMTRNEVSTRSAASSLGLIGIVAPLESSAPRCRCASAACHHEAPLWFRFESAMNRIDTLMARMTLSEKLGQLTMTASGYTVTGPVIAGDSTQSIIDGTIGNLLNMVGAGPAHEMQRLAVENSRLGIP